MTTTTAHPRRLRRRKAMTNRIGRPANLAPTTRKARMEQDIQIGRRCNNISRRLVRSCRIRRVSLFLGFSSVVIQKTDMHVQKCVIQAAVRNHNHPPSCRTLPSLTTIPAPTSLHSCLPTWHLQHDSGAPLCHTSSTTTPLLLQYLLLRHPNPNRNLIHKYQRNPS